MTEKSLPPGALPRQEDESAIVLDSRRKPEFGIVYYADITHPAFKALKDAHRVVYVHLCVYANRRSREAWPLQKTLAEDTGYCTRTIVRGVKALEAAGFLIVVRKKTGPIRYVNEYTLTSPCDTGS